MKFKHGKNFSIKGKGVYIDKSVIIGDNVTIYANCQIIGSTIIKDGAVIMQNCYIKDSIIGENSLVEYSFLENAIVGKGCSVGPYARLRPNSLIGDGAKIGNFVEIKNSKIGSGAKISHLAYVGDAEIGKDCNIGCGAIFVNYNGREKNKTIVGDNVFIGSNCNIIAPVTICSKSYICAGTTVTDNVNSDDFVIGRAKQNVKQNRAHLYLKEDK